MNLLNTKAKDFTDWYNENYSHLTNYGLWLRGNEPHTIPKEAYYTSDLKVLIARLSTYRDTLHSFTHTILYEIIQSCGSVYPDLAYLPSPQDGEILDKENIPWLLGTTSKIDATGFDILAFSNSIVEELINIPVMLTKSNIPLSKKERMDRVDCPLILLGGSNAPFTSLFFVKDPPVDAIFMGNDFNEIKKVFQECKDAKMKGVSKQDLLIRLESCKGICIPDKETQHVTVANSRTIQNPTAPITLYSHENVPPAHLKLSEGCACFCSFCAESWVHKPYIEAGVEELIANAKRIKEMTGSDEIELYSYNFNMHHNFYNILWKLVEIFPKIGLKSQRFDMIAQEPEILKYLHVVNKTSITCGLEGISERMRKYLHKSLDLKTVQRSISALCRASIREIKISCIVTGFESDIDFLEFKDFCRNLSLTLQAIGKKPRIIFSITPLIRFPHTPLESEDAPSPENLRLILLQAERIINGHGFECRNSADVNNYIISQLFTRAHDEILYEALIETINESKFVFYETIPDDFIEILNHQLRIRKVHLQKLLQNFSNISPQDYKWNRIETGIDKLFFEKKKNDAKKFIDSGYCIGLIDREGECQVCGACDDTTRKNIIQMRSGPSFTPDQFSQKVKSYNRNTSKIWISLNLNNESRGIPRNAIAPFLMHTLFDSTPALINIFRGYGTSFSENYFQSSWVNGFDIFELQFTNEPAPSTLIKQEFIDKANETFNKYGKILKIHESHPFSTSTSIKLNINSDFAFTPDKYFKEQRIKATLVKLKDSSNQGNYSVYNYNFSSDTLKRKLIESLTVKRFSDNHFELELIPGAKFFYPEFISNAFTTTFEKDWVRIQTECEFME